jgi:hypothetical protein
MHNSKLTVRERRDQKTARESLKAILFMSFVAICLVALALSLNTPRKSANTNPASPKDYSIDEIKSFWNEHLETVTAIELIAGKYHIPEIRDRYAEIYTNIVNKFGKLNVVMSYSRPIESGAIAGTTYPERVPTINIFVIEFMDLYYGEFKQKYEDRREEYLQNLCVTTIMHEMEHIGSDKSHADGHTRVREDLIADEKQAWAKTCKYTYTPLVEKYHINLPRGEQIVYDEWLKNGRNEDSPGWNTFIRRIYSDVKYTEEDGVTLGK